MRPAHLWSTGLEVPLTTALFLEFHLLSHISYNHLFPTDIVHFMCLNARRKMCLYPPSLKLLTYDHFQIRDALHAISSLIEVGSQQ